MVCLTLDRPQWSEVRSPKPRYWEYIEYGWPSESATLVSIGSIDQRCGELTASFYAILYKWLEHPWILVSWNQSPADTKGKCYLLSEGFLGVLSFRETLLMWCGSAVRRMGVVVLMAALSEEALTILPPNLKFCSCPHVERRRERAISSNNLLCRIHIPKAEWVFRRCMYYCVLELV